jgi:predicted PurR-regulated permease PerM
VKEHVGLPTDDPQVQVLARNSGARVAVAIRRESYADVFNAYFESAVRSSRAWLQDELKELASLATGWTVGLVGGIFDFFMVLMLTAFYLVYFPRVRDYVRDLVAPQYREDYGKVLKRIDMRLSGAIRGQVIICIVNATLTFPGLWFIGTHTDATNLAAYAVLLSVLAGVLSMIPIFGVILSTVPMVILALAQGSMGGATLVVGWICVIHAIEAYLLNPNILGHSASMNPIIVVFALLAGKQVYGLVGALLAVPVASVLVSLFGYYRRLVAARVAQEEGVTVPVDTWGD